MPCLYIPSLKVTNFSYSSIAVHTLAGQAVFDGGFPSPFAETAAPFYPGRDSERHSSNRIGSAPQPSLVRYNPVLGKSHEQDAQRQCTRFDLSLNVSILNFSGQDITSRIPVYYHDLTNNNHTTTKRNLLSSYAIHHCPDHHRFISSRCIRARGPQAWSISCRDDTFPGMRTIHYGKCDPLQICTDLSKSLKEGPTALCLDQTEDSTAKGDHLTSIGRLDGGAVELEVVVTSREAPSTLPVQSIRVWEGSIHGSGQALSSRTSPPGGGHCSNCSSLVVSRIGNHARSVDVQVNLSQGKQDARVVLMSTSEAQ